MKDATDLPYDTDSFDCVVIADALHIMPDPDKAMMEICRVLKSGGILIAPTFIHGAGFGYHFRTRLMVLIGFKVFSKWSADGFAEYVQRFGFEIYKQSVIGSSLTPLYCLAAGKR